MSASPPQFLPETKDQDIERYLPRETQVYVRRVEKYAAEFGGPKTMVS